MAIIIAALIPVLTLQRVEVRHVRLEPRRALAEPRRVLLQALGLESDQRDVRSLRVQALGARLADAARGARDEHGATFYVVAVSCRASHASFLLTGGGGR